MVEVRLALESGPGAPRTARRALWDSFPDLPDHRHDDVGLLVSELVMNSVVHVPGASQQAIGLHAAIRDSVLRVEVSDRSPVLAARRPSSGDSGFGLNFVERIADRWGIDLRDDVQVVWFELVLR
jgi:anti-sigma regulatory factor (Ser/Thr protein kinase)